MQETLAQTAFIVNTEAEPVPMQHVTCQACKRVHKWREEMAGTEFLCHCGEWVYCPAPGDSSYEDQIAELSKSEAFTKQNEFDVDHGFDGSSSQSGSSIEHRSAEEIEDISADVGEISLDTAVTLETGKRRRGQSSLGSRKARIKAVTGRGFMGMNPFAELCVWTIGSMLGFTFAVLAIMNPSHVAYIVLAVCIGPASWYMLRRSYVVWKRGRRLVIAIDEQLTRERVDNAGA